MVRRLLDKVKTYSFSEKLVAVLAVVALAILLLPLLRLAMYTTPWYDDYNYTQFTKSFIAQDGVWPGILNGALYTTKTWWWCWQGTYSSIFMMTLSPLCLGEEYYPLGVMAIILFFAFASMVLGKTVSKHVMKANRSTQIIVGVLVTATLIELIHTSQQGLFWYNAAVHYTFMHGVAFLFLAVLIKIYYAKNMASACGFMVLEAFLAFVCAGSNFVTALQGFLTLAIAIFLAILFKNKRCYFYLAPTIVYVIGLYKNLSAPGNSVRSAYFQGYGAVESVFYSFVSAFKHFWEFTGVVFFVILALYVLIVWNTVKEMKFSFRFPGIVSFFSLCFYATGFTSSYYGMGGEGVARTWVAIKFTLLILMFINATYWLGWGMKRWRKKKEREVAQAKHYVWAYALAFVGILLCFVCEKDQAGNYSSYGAYYYVHTGEAANHHAEYVQRIETIKNGGDNVEVKPLVWKPWFLYKGELSTSPNAEPNTSMANWYGKQSITLKIEDETE